MVINKPILQNIDYKNHYLLQTSGDRKVMKSEYLLGQTLYFLCPAVVCKVTVNSKH